VEAGTWLETVRGVQLRFSGQGQNLSAVPQNIE
jgi:hypothetical protein